MAIRIGIFGYGNLGRGVELAVQKAPDMELAAVFTRRDPRSLRLANPQTPAVAASELPTWRERIDVLVLCGGSATDLPEQTPALAREFTVVDSFDTHASIPEHFDAVDRAAREGGRLGIISVGWDPGLFSLARAYAQAILPEGSTYTFWGRGVSQGHSDAIRRIEGVEDARQYTVPVETALEAVRRGEHPTLSPRQKHTRECYVVAKEGADRARIEREIVTMPHYFDEYDTTVHFISRQEMAEQHAALPHGGTVLHSANTGVRDEHSHIIEYRLTLDSNPEFTSSVLVAYARAAHRLHREGAVGCRTVLDIPPAYLAAESGDALRRQLL